MAICELTGKRPVVKNLVSHSNIKTKSINQPNVQKKRLFSPTLGTMVCLKVATGTIREMEHRGSFDSFIMHLSEQKMSKRARKIRSRIKKKLNSKKAG